MAYFTDLSEYIYRKDYANGEYNVGWLDVSKEYPKGELTNEFLDRLWEYLPYNITQMRGFHECNLCSEKLGYLEVEKGNDKFKLGSAEIRVIGIDGKVYAAPNLIYHYIQYHKYMPPEEFVNAVLYGCSPNSKKYIKYVKENCICDIFLEEYLERKLRDLKMKDRK